MQGSREVDLIPVRMTAEDLWCASEVVGGRCLGSSTMEWAVGMPRSMDSMPELSDITGEGRENLWHVQRINSAAFPFLFIISL